MTGEGTKFVDKFLDDNNVHRTEYQGSHSFEGNHARKLLKIIDRMRHEVDNLESESADKERIMEIISTLEAFDGVVFACFSKSPRDRSRSPARDKSDRHKKHGFYNNGGKRKGKFNKSKGQNSNNKSGSDKQE